jgi:hypothetical protein
MGLILYNLTSRRHLMDRLHNGKDHPHGTVIQAPERSHHNEIYRNFRPDKQPSFPFLGRFCLKNFVVKQNAFLSIFERKGIPISIRHVVPMAPSRFNRPKEWFIPFREAGH